VADLRGRSILIATKSQLSAALALLELDGLARRLVLCTPDLTPEHIDAVAAAARADALVHDGPFFDAAPGLSPRVAVAPAPVPGNFDRVATGETEWVLLTSGTTGAPKLVAHTLASLAGRMAGSAALGHGSVWSTFYDVRRYGGLQIFLRAVLGDASLVLSSADEPVGAFLKRAGGLGVTHISGTPTHWRRALMSGSAHHISPRYVRLSGEIADQAILDALHAAYPDAKVAHAFASTEAGVAFDVDDGLAGFPASLLDRVGGNVELKVEDGTLRIRSARNAASYLGGAERLVQDDGFVDTGDLVELREDGRYHFMGRRGGVINIGGQKVHPEEVEAVINSHPMVRLSLVHGRKSPITGSIVVAEVVLRDGKDGVSAEETVKGEIIATCRNSLPPHKVPASIRFVPSLAVSPSGKLARPNA
jgi:acyl-coenzyme A synthetase/AMP-(fatty) acid ligase